MQFGNTRYLSVLACRNVGGSMSARIIKWFPDYLTSPRWRHSPCIDRSDSMARDYSHFWALTFIYMADWIFEKIIFQFRTKFVIKLQRRPLALLCIRNWFRRISDQRIIHILTNRVFRQGAEEWGSYSSLTWPILVLSIHKLIHTALNTLPAPCAPHHEQEPGILRGETT